MIEIITTGWTEERTDELENRKMDIIQSEQQRKYTEKKKTLSLIDG